MARKKSLEFTFIDCLTLYCDNKFPRNRWARVEVRESQVDGLGLGLGIAIDP